MPARVLGSLVLVVPLVLPLLACGGSRKRVAPTAPTVAAMHGFDASGYTLSGAEYWPYAGTVDIDYPRDVLWGFYPKQGVVAPGEDDPNLADASPVAVACAETAYRALQAFIASDPPALRMIVQAGAASGFTTKFYLWTNDYTHAAAPYPPGVRPARLWYWHRKTPDATRPPGYWKWESSVDQHGECHIPEQAQIDAYLATTQAELAGTPAGTAP